MRRSWTWSPSTERLASCRSAGPCPISIGARRCSSPRKIRTCPKLLDALAPAAVAVGVGLAKHKKRWFEPDPANLEILEKSTTMLAKTLGWTARVLGVTPPSLYITSDQNAWLDVAPTEQPNVLAGRGLGSGLGLSELAFLLGRHAARFRPELRLFAFFATAPELA